MICRCRDSLSTSFSVERGAGGHDRPDACARQQGFYLRRDKLDISIYNRQHRCERRRRRGHQLYRRSRKRHRHRGRSTPSRHGSSPEIPCAPIGEPPIGRPYISGYAFAASVLGDGTLTADRTDEKSALKPGMDAQIEIANWPALRSASSNRHALLPDRLSRRSARHMAFRQRGSLINSIGGSAAATHQFSSAIRLLLPVEGRSRWAYA